MADEPLEWTCVYKVRAAIGEIPTWSDGGLFWVNMFEPSINRLDLSTGQNQRWMMPDIVGTYGLMQGDARAVVAIRSGLFHLDFSTGELTLLRDPPYDSEHYRYNDGRCDRAGRLWVGTNVMPNSNKPAGSAAFYKYDGDRLTEEVGGLTIANGTAWSPDDKTMYLADRPNWQILAFDYDIATGTVANRRHFATIPEGQIPDGATVDTEGGYWIALFGAGRIVRFDRTGRLDRSFQAPTPHPTMIAFGGPNHDDLYLTTACFNYDDAMFAEHPEAGSIFVCKSIGYTGLPEPKFVDRGAR